MPVAQAPPGRNARATGGALSFVYVFQIYQYDFWRGERTGARGGWPQQAVVGALAVLVLVGGLWAEPLLAASRNAAQALSGGER